MSEDDNIRLESEEQEESNTSDSLIGRKFGDYAVQQFLGEGAFAEVYLARDKLDRFVALKILKKQFSFDVHFANMFRREATTAARLNHEHIILIYDQGEVEGLFYMAMEHAPEGTLEDYLKRKEGSLTRSEVRDFTQQIAAALDFAHTNGIIHRDIKPSNILLSYNNRIKLADFGIARAQQPGTERFSTVIQGTAHYMAPEQANPSSKFDARVDVYALGVVVYQMLSGRLPFGDAKSIDFVEQIQTKRTGKPKAIPEWPAYVQQVLFKALSPTPDLRHRSVQEFADDLIRAIDQWEATTAVRQDKRDLIGTAMLAMEQEDWRAAKDYLERAQKLGTSDIIEKNLNEVNRRIRLQDEWAKVNECFARADWQTAIEALKRILQIQPQDESAPLKLAEAEKQIELNRLYEDGEKAFAQEDYALAVERFETIYQQFPEYRDVANRLQEFKQTQTKDEFNRLRVEALWALVENDVELISKHAQAIQNLGLGDGYGASTFLDRFNQVTSSIATQQSEQSTMVLNLKDTLKVQSAHIEQQKLEIDNLKLQSDKKQKEIEKLRVEVNDLQREFTDRLYDYVSDLQNTLSLLEANMVTRYSAKELIQTLRERIRQIALRGQQLESKTIY
jgi:serine/threonine protein kinase